MHEGLFLPPRIGRGMLLKRVQLAFTNSVFLPRGGHTCLSLSQHSRVADGAGHCSTVPLLTGLVCNLSRDDPTAEPELPGSSLDTPFLSSSVCPHPFFPPSLAAVASWQVSPWCCYLLVAPSPVPQGFASDSDNNGTSYLVRL